MATIQNDRDISLQGTVPRLTATSIILTASAQAFVRQKNEGAAVPSTIHIDTVTSVFTAPTYQWYYTVSNAITTYTAISGATLSYLDISAGLFETYIGDALFARFKCVATQTNYTTAENYIDILYTKQNNDPVTISLQTPVSNVVATSSGSVSTLPPSNFIRLHRNGVQLTTGVTYGTTATKNGLTATVDSTGQIILTQSSWSTDSESFTFTASLSGITYTTTYVITKAKAGASGNSTYTGTIYLQQSTAPASPTGGSYNFSTSTLTAPSGWSISQPSSTTVPTWACTYTFTGLPSSTINASGTWSTVYLEAVAGLDGQWIDVLELYGTSSTAPTGSSIGYTFSTNTFSGSGMSGWSSTQPAVGASPIYMTTARVTTTTPSVTLYPPVWSTPVVVAQKGANGAVGPAGTDGNKSVTISAFKWSNAGVGSYAQAFLYTWAGGAVSAYPSGWSSSAGTAPGTGYTLYQLNLTIIDTVSASTTSSTWSSASTNSIGYRQDGTIGVQGDSARIAYVVSTSASAPALTTNPTSGSTSVPTSTGLTWSLTPSSSLSPGQFMYQSDGIYNITTNTVAWNAAYLSNLKVGSLSALSADLGVVSISSSGSLYSSGKTYGSATAGFFLGYDSSAYKFDIGNSTNYLRWNGSALSIQGNITGTSSIDITGTSYFNGASTGSGYQAAAVFNNNSGTTSGLVGIANTGTSYAHGVIGISNYVYGTGAGVSGFTSSQNGGAGLYGQSIYSSGYALKTAGNVEIGYGTTYHVQAPVTYDAYSTVTFGAGASFPASQTAEWSSGGNLRSKSGTATQQLRIRIDGSDYWVDFY